MIVLSPRKNQILTIVIREHVKHAEPVGSKSIQESYEFPISSATIRNEMAELEDMGYLAQPHISAGRIPTIAAYRYYADHALDTIKPDRSFFKQYTHDDAGEDYRALAKLLSEATGAGVFIMSDPTHVYYTGLVHLFQKPEFHSPEFMRHMGATMDRLEDVLMELAGELTDDIEVLLGEENPFGAWYSTIVARCNRPDHTAPLVGVMGPVRIDYDRVLSLLTGLQAHLKDE